MNDLFGYLIFILSDIIAWGLVAYIVSTFETCDVKIYYEISPTTSSSILNYLNNKS